MNSHPSDVTLQTKSKLATPLLFAQFLFLYLLVMFFFLVLDFLIQNRFPGHHLGASRLFVLNSLSFLLFCFTIVIFTFPLCHLPASAAYPVQLISWWKYFLGLTLPLSLLVSSLSVCLSSSIFSLNSVSGFPTILS